MIEMFVSFGVDIASIGALMVILLALNLLIIPIFVCVCGLRFKVVNTLFVDSVSGMMRCSAKNGLTLRPPPIDRYEGAGGLKIIDLDLSKYDRIAERFARSKSSILPILSNPLLGFIIILPIKKNTQRVIFLLASIRDYSRTSCALTLRVVLCTFKIVNPADFVKPSARVHHHSPNKKKHPAGDFFIGGERGIRTLGTLAHTHAFQAGPFSHSGTSPFLFFYPCYR
jgi:hypothetical protein